MSKLNLVIIVLMVIVTTSFFIFITSTASDSYKPGIHPETDAAVSQAQHLYNLAIESKVDLTNGPCLSNSLISGWVLDIVHSPRSPIDDLPENQCQSYRIGQAKHFVELDTKGNLIRVK